MRASPDMWGVRLDQGKLLLAERPKRILSERHESSEVCARIDCSRRRIWTETKGVFEHVWREGVATVRRGERLDVLVRGRGDERSA